MARMFKTCRLSEYKGVLKGIYFFLSRRQACTCEADESKVELNKNYSVGEDRCVSAVSIWAVNLTFLSINFCIYKIEMINLVLLSFKN